MHLGMAIKSHLDPPVSENGQVAYQIKGNDMYNNMQAIILFLIAPSGQKFFLKIVMLHIKGNEKYENMQANILTLHTPSKGVKRLNHFSSESSYVKYQMNTAVDHALTLVIWVGWGVGGSVFFFI